MDLAILLCHRFHPFLLQLGIPEPFAKASAKAAASAAATVLVEMGAEAKAKATADAELANLTDTAGARGIEDPEVDEGEEMEEEEGATNKAADAEKVNDSEEVNDAEGASVAKVEDEDLVEEGETVEEDDVASSSDNADEVISGKLAEDDSSSAGGVVQEDFEHRWSTDLLGFLGLSADFSVQDIKKASRRFRIIHHPDKGGTKDNFIFVENACGDLSFCCCDRTSSAQKDEPCF